MKWNINTNTNTNTNLESNNICTIYFLSFIEVCNVTWITQDTTKSCKNCTFLPFFCVHGSEWSGMKHARQRKTEFISMHGMVMHLEHSFIY